MFARLNILVRVAAICSLMSLLAPVAHAMLDYSIAEVRGDVIYVKGSGAARKQEINWNGNPVTSANPKGNFSFEVELHNGCLPGNCSGTLTTDPDITLTVTVTYPSTEPPSEPPSEPPKLELKYRAQHSHGGEAVRAVGFVADVVDEVIITRVVSGGADSYLRYWSFTPDYPYQIKQIDEQALSNIPYDLDANIPNNLAEPSIVTTGEGGWKGHAGAETLRVWEAFGDHWDLLKETQATQAPIGFVYSVAVSPVIVDIPGMPAPIPNNYYWIAASGFYGDILVYLRNPDDSLEPLKLYATSATRKKRTTALDISPDGSLLASASSGGIQLRSFPQGNCTSVSCVLDLLLTLNHPGSWVFRIAFWPGSTPQATKIVSGTDSGTIKIWTIDTTIPAVLSVDSVDSGAVYSLDWSPNGDMIVTGGNGDITVYDSAELTNILFRNSDEDAHAGRVNDVVFSPDSSQIVSGGADGDLKVWGLD